MATSCDLVITRWGARFMGLQFPCAVGRGGIGEKRGEGDGVTPAGSFRVLEVLFRPDRVWSGETPIGLRDVWSDDPKDSSYNTKQLGHPYPYSHERLRRADPMYDLIADLDYNRGPIRSGAGSAIFLHVWRKPRHPTEGCVAFARCDLAFILEHWTTGSRVIIGGH